MRSTWVMAAVAGLAFLLVRGVAQAVPPPTAFAPPSSPGPALTVPQQVLDDALACKTDLAAAGQEPVLLLPGTSTTPEVSFDWNFIPAFDVLGVPYCTLTLPMNNNGDVQIHGEYVVNAVRSMYAESGRKVQVLGWSQGGGPMPRWALRWWPDIRPMVDGLIGVDPSNSGSAVGDLFGCEIVALVCPPALWQQMPQSNFIAALNSGAMTFSEVNYTVIYNRLSNLVQPNLNGESSALPPGPNVTNIALQDFCGGMLSMLPDHGVAVGNPATLALVLDTLAHPGAPGDPNRVDRTTCGQLGTPYVSAADQAQAIGSLYADAFLRTVPRDTVPAEPPLRCYVYTTAARPAGCS
ncbi:hypothetical protein OG921_03145 [Aldersonia sp. NBC_00410]|uniref:esterase/lipase family protein n=1 Tax=Aldersonia sp. NBC_00410 TaxID=2975954 RepID=UPI00224EA5EA|nr:hypothetical protein [Aldersonia sp. NBC_00410]MCX5042187.1 hypothetical protein [Aldersonia sp. NBC_00410]